MVSLGTALPRLRRASSRPPLLEGVASLADEALGRMLDSLGDRRLLQRSAAYRRELARYDAAEVLYRGLMEALGYAAHRRPFRQLAHRLPYRELAALRGEPRSVRGRALLALLVHAAGLMSMVGDDESQLLRGLLRRLRRRRPMPRGSWAPGRGRPANQPLRRLRGMAVLLERSLDRGLVPWLMGRVEDGRPGDLVAALRAAPYIGRGRALTMAATVVLPFAHAWAVESARPEMVRATWEVYRALPSPEEDATTREMKGLLASRGRALRWTARRHQGLHLLRRELPRRLTPRG